MTHARIRFLSLFCLCSGLSLAFSVPALAAKFNRVLDIGSAAPAWSDLPGTDGQPHALADFRDAKLVVVIFLRNHCPIADKHTARINEFAKTHAAKGVAVVALNVSRLPGESLEQMTRHAQAKQFTFPYVRDESQQVAKTYGATCTPHVFLLDADRKIAYMGRFDDHDDAKQVTRHYLADAVAALLAGRPVDTKETLQRGCGIDYPDEDP